MNFLHLSLTSSSPDNITNWGPSVPMPKMGHFLLKILDHPTSVHLLTTGFCLTLTCFMSTKLINWFLCLDSFDVYECFCLKVWGNFWWDSGVGQIWALLWTQSCMFQMWANFPSYDCWKGNPSSLVFSLSKSSDKELMIASHMTCDY